MQIYHGPHILTVAPSVPFTEAFLCVSIIFLQHPSLPSVGLKSWREIRFQYFPYFSHKFFFSIVVLFLESNASLCFSLHRKLTLRSATTLIGKLVWFFHGCVPQDMHFSLLSFWNAFCSSNVMN